MPARAILRIAKLKGAGKVAASGEHLERTRETPNADPTRTHLNRRLIGSGDLWADIQERLATLPTAPKRNAVHGIELLLSASPSYFARNDFDQLRTWASTSFFWAQERFGADNVVAAMLHRDEETPHLHIVVVPIVEKILQGRTEPEPRLCARDITGGRYRLSKLQDEYADAVKGLGLERGVKGARIEYAHLHQRYSAMTTEAPEIAKVVKGIQVQAPGLFTNREEWAAKEQDRIQGDVHTQLAHVFARKEELERRAGQDQKRITALERQLDQAQTLAARARTLDLGRIVQLLGGIQDRADPHLWRLAGATISIDGARYQDVTQRHEGVGAVDLLMHTTGCDYEKALAYLAYKGSPEMAAIGAAEYAGREALHYAERVGHTPIELKPQRTEPEPIRNVAINQKPQRQGHERDDHDDWGR